MVIFASLFYIFQPHSDAAIHLNKGNVAPPFTLSDAQGNDVSLARFRGKKVVLNFFTTWCPPCQEELPEIEQFAKETEGRNVVTIGINLTSEESGKEAVLSFLKQAGIHYPILFDDKGRVKDVYQIVVIPTTFIIDQEGKIEEKLVGPVSKEQLHSLTAN